MQIRKYIPTNRGFTLVETLIYAIGVVLLIGVITGLMYYMYNWYQYATIASKVDQTGLVLMDRLVRDIRTGTSIDFGQSSFNSTNGSIFINSKESGVNVTKKFSLQNGRILYQENGGTAQYLTPANMTAVKLYLTSITTSLSQAVRVELQITYTTRSGLVTHDFNGLSIMRQSYD